MNYLAEVSTRNNERTNKQNDCRPQVTSRAPAPNANNAIVENDLQATAWKWKTKIQVGFTPQLAPRFEIDSYYCNIIL